MPNPGMSIAEKVEKMMSRTIPRIPERMIPLSTRHVHDGFFNYPKRVSR